MADRPCAKEWDEYIAAMQEWMASVGAHEQFIHSEPLDPHKDRPPMNYEAMKAAFDKSDALQRKYQEKMEAYFKCIGK